MKGPNFALSALNLKFSTCTPLQPASPEKSYLHRKYAMRSFILMHSELARHKNGSDSTLNRGNVTQIPCCPSSLHQSCELTREGDYRLLSYNISIKLHTVCWAVHVFLLPKLKGLSPWIYHLRKCEGFTLTLNVKGRNSYGIMFFLKQFQQCWSLMIEMEV